MVSLKERFAGETQGQRHRAAFSRALFEATPDAVMDIGDGMVDDANEAAFAVTGLARDHLVGSPFLDLFADPVKVQEGLNAVVAHGNVRDYPVSLRGKAGAVATLLSATSYRDDAGSPLRMVAVLRPARFTGSDTTHLPALFEANLDALLIVSPEGIIIEANAAAVSVTGLARESLAGSDFALRFTEPALARELHRQAMQNGAVRDFPLTFRHKDGTLTDVINNASLYRDGQGNVVGVLIAGRDVTHSNRLMTELIESKNFLDNILQSSTKYSIIGKDIDRRILSWNEGARRNYGYEADEILGKDSAMLHAPEDIASGAVEKLMREAHDRGVAEGEFVRVRKDGSRFTASVVMTRRNDAAGHPIGYLLMSHDITEKKQADEQLQQASRYARSLIEASLDPLVTIGTGGRITDVNEAATKVTGVSRDDLIGSEFAGHFTDPAKAQEGCREIFEKGFIRDYTLTIRSRDGKLTDLLYNASVFRDSRGKVLGALAAGRDITEIKALNRALEQRIAERTAQNREILDAAESLASFSSGIMASMSQIASGVTETAVTVNETTAVVEEVKMTAQVSSEKARKVAEVAQEAVAVAQAGRKAVEESVGAMGQIQDHVSSTAEGILRLAGKSQTADEIIATVQDLAEQANLLAVNAAIEAAKAGDQGKGFTVVAQELKSLAEQSRAATIQVRSILKDIQSAGRAAVQATEKGKEMVEAGVRQSTKAGDAIRQMESIVSDSAQSGRQIDSSSREQLVGMDQVAQAMRNIKQASDDNAFGVKDVESALQKVNDLGRKLKLLVEQYR